VTGRHLVVVPYRHTESVKRREATAWVLAAGAIALILAAAGLVLAWVLGTTAPGDRR
jgi:hypothetical protein